MWIFFAFIAVAVFGCIAVYKTAEVHELHKMRAAFENRRRHIQRLVEEHQNQATLGKTIEEMATPEELGELESLDEVIDIINDELDQVSKLF